MQYAIDLDKETALTLAIKQWGKILKKLVFNKSLSEHGFTQLQAAEYKRTAYEQIAAKYDVHPSHTSCFLCNITIASCVDCPLANVGTQICSNPNSAYRAWVLNPNRTNTHKMYSTLIKARTHIRRNPE